MKNLNSIAVGFFIALAFIALAAFVMLIVFPEVMELYRQINSFILK